MQTGLGALWGSMGLYGAAVGLYGALWGSIGLYGALWGGCGALLGGCGALWGSMGRLWGSMGRLWKEFSCGITWAEPDATPPRPHLRAIRGFSVCRSG